MIVSTEPSMFKDLISTNEDSLNYQTGDRFYNNLYRSTIEDYVFDMRERIEIDIQEGGDYSDENPYEWRDYARHQLVNTIPKTEHEFLSAIGEDAPAVRVCRIIMKMEEVVKEYYEQNGFDFDMSVVGDIGKLYSMWIYAITDEVDFDIDYDDEVILLRPQ
jgi:hypothetical protein